MLLREVKLNYSFPITKFRFHSKLMKLTQNLLLMLGAASLLFTSCKSALHRPMTTSDARIGEETPFYSELAALPQPRDPIVAAVYKFRDHTGQYKPSENGANWSTAVTQGATSILIRAMEESNWFVPIERENLSNLLNERKIIRSSRAQYEDSPANLPPLLFAGIVLEGGIVSYQTNIVTGGAGLRYFGAGASGQYREDKVNIYLRAVSTSNGKILKTVYTSKTILSQTVDVGLFRFVSFKRLLEAETGFTYNEPSDMAVTEAIEKAVVGLVVEGAQENLWSFADSTAWENPTVQNYLSEQKANLNTDEFGKRVTDVQTNHKFGMGPSGGFWLYDGDLPEAQLQPAGNVSLFYNPGENFGLSLNIGQGSLATEFGYDQSFVNVDLLGHYRFAPQYPLTPSLFGGISVLTDPELFGAYNLADSRYHGVLGASIEQKLGSQWILHLDVFNNFGFNDELDGEVQGKYNDFFWGSRVGVKYYFPRSKKP